VSPAAQAYVNGRSVRDWFITQDAAGASLQGDLFRNWAGPVSFATGVEYRHESANITADPLSVIKGFSIGAQVPWSGAVGVWEGFGEVSIPLVRDASWAKAIDLDVAGRYTHYTTSGGVTTWKIGGSYDVTSSLRFRITRSRDIRAPSLAELFQGESQVNSIIIDPLNNQSLNVRTPVVGNPALKPEKANTLTAGVLYAPPFVPGLRLSVDYYDIKVNGAITTLTAQSIIDRCEAGVTTACDQITRTNGPITNVNVVPLNLQQLHARGIDFEAGYRLPIGANSSFELRALVNYTDKFTLIDQGVALELAGAVQQPTIEGIGGQPHWRSNIRSTFRSGPLTFNLISRYVGGGVIDLTRLTSADTNKISTAGRRYFDLSSELDVYPHDPGRLQLFAAVHNVLDNDPPITGGGFNTAATSRALYDQIGRRFTAGARVKF
jgi:outer membrane receptor protein involved in Fe transport